MHARLWRAGCDESPATPASSIPSVQSSSGRRAVGEIVKRGDAVGFRPYTDCAGARDVGVVLLDVGLAVEDDADPRPLEFHAQNVPNIRPDGCVHILDRDPPPALGVVERHIVLERVGARDIVMITVLPSPHDAPCLVLPASFRPELDLDEPVGERNVLLLAPRNTADT